MSLIYSSKLENNILQTQCFINGKMAELSVQGSSLGSGLSLVDVKVKNRHTVHCNTV